jgi:thymidylate synthase
MTPVQLVEEVTLGRGWLEISRRILEAGGEEAYDGRPTRELAHVTLVISEPDPDDELVVSLADPSWLAWMTSNFTEPDDVPELGYSRSYARRLRDYDGRDQVQWVIGRLRSDPETRSATIFQPLTDTSYVPCVSLLDFWRSEDRLELVVYAHSLDFGKKASGQLTAATV